MSSCVIIPPKPRGGTESGAHSHGTACFGDLSFRMVQKFATIRVTSEVIWKIPVYRERSSVDV